MVQPRSREGDGSVGLRVERVDLVPTDMGTIVVRVAGRWAGDPVPAVPVLRAGDRRFDALRESSGAAERAAGGEGAFRAAFAVPEELRPSLLGPLRMTVGETEVSLPAANEVEGVPSGAAGTVVDRAVLAERRARRAELAEEEGARRAEEAEGSVAALEAELAKLELRLEQASSERAELQARLADAARDARAASQRAHAERRRREEAIEDAADRADEAEREAARLRARLQVGDERARALAREAEALRRRVSEAEQISATAEIARRQAEHEATAARPRLGEDRHRLLRQEATLAALRPPPARRPPTLPDRPGPARDGLSGLLSAEERMVRARAREAGPADLREESRRAAGAVADAAWALSEARDAVGSVSGGVDAVRAELARVEAERDALAAERERLAGARAAAEAQSRRLREELSLQAESQARAERAVADLAGRVEELQEAAAAARRGAEAEAAVRELSSAAADALREAERRIGEAHRAASEAQDRLDAERADRERAEREMRAAFEAERDRLHHELEPATARTAADLESRIAALETALEQALARPGQASSEPEPALARPGQAPSEPEPALARPARPPRPASEPAGVAGEREAGAAEAASPRAARPGALVGPRSTWLPAALERLVAESPGDAARLGVQLLPAQALGTAGPLDYDLCVADVGWHAVTTREGRGTVAPLEEHRGRRAADFRLHLDATALVRLLIEGGSPGLRRAGRFKLRGTLRRRRAARSIPAAELDLARLADAHVWPDPGLVLTALAGLIEPEWTAGHAFAVAMVVLGPRGGRWRARAADGAPLSVGPARTAEEADATVRMTQGAYQRLLAGRPGRDDRRTHVTGNVAAVATLVGWIERAQREAG